MPPLSEDVPNVAPSKKPQLYVEPLLIKKSFLGCNPKRAIPQSFTRCSDKDLGLVLSVTLGKPSENDQKCKHRPRLTEHAPSLSPILSA